MPVTNRPLKSMTFADILSENCAWIEPRVGPSYKPFSPDIYIFVSGINIVINSLVETSETSLSLSPLSSFHNQVPNSIHSSSEIAISPVRCLLLLLQA